jgi:hypothetical protein
VSVAGRDGRFGRRQSLSVVTASGALYPWSMEILAAAGRYVVVWWRSTIDSESIYYAVSDQAGQFSRARKLGDTGPNEFISAAVGPAGTVTAAWYSPYCGCFDPPPLCEGCGPATEGLAYSSLAAGAAEFGRVRVIRTALTHGSITSLTANAGPGGSGLAWTEQGGAVPGATAAAVGELPFCGHPIDYVEPLPLAAVVRTLRLDRVPGGAAETVSRLPTADGTPSM